MSSQGTTPYANGIFEQPWWLDAVVPGGWRELLVDVDDEIVARWAFAEDHKIITTPQLTQTSGFWIADKVVESDSQFTLRKKITNQLLDQMPFGKRTTLNLDPRVTYFLPMVWHGFQVEPRVSYRFSDVSHPDLLYRGFSGKTRQCIRTAAEKVRVKTSDDIEPLLRLIDQSFARQGLRNPWSPELIRRIFRACREHQAAYLIYGEDSAGNLHAGNLYIYDEKVCYALLSGSDPAWKSAGARTLLAWEGIRFASTVSQAFDFEGSMVEGIEHYFRQFGATPLVYYHIHRETPRQQASRAVNNLLRSTAKKWMYRMIPARSENSMVSKPSSHVAHFLSRQ